MALWTRVRCSSDQVYKSAFHLSNCFNIKRVALHKDLQGGDWRRVADMSWHHARRCVRSRSFQAVYCAYSMVNLMDVLAQLCPPDYLHEAPEAELLHCARRSNSKWLPIWGVQTLLCTLTVHILWDMGDAHNDKHSNHSSTSTSTSSVTHMRLNFQAIIMATTRATFTKIYRK